MTAAQGKEEGICAGLGLSHAPPWDGGSVRTHTRTESEYSTKRQDQVNYMSSYITTRCSMVTTNTYDNAQHTLKSLNRYYNQGFCRFEQVEIQEFCIVIYFTIYKETRNKTQDEGTDGREKLSRRKMNHNDNMCTF